MNTTPEVPTVPSKICSQCGLEKPLTDFYKDIQKTDGHYSRCKTCHNISTKTWMKKNQNTYATYKKEYMANYRKEHAGEIKIQRAQYNREHTEERKIYATEYRKDHLEQEKIREVLYKKNNPEKIREKKRRERAIKAKAPIRDFTAAQWAEMQIAFNHRCAYCGKRAKGHLTQDHITPLSQGGSHTLSNIVPACRSCNSRKQAGPPPIPVQPLLLTVVPNNHKQVARCK